ncbi:transmembrane protein 45B-like isoform X4 [Heliangelus exortis]|uniref:transmembrane protein 45B-like isoform X4 n=1 Tax=Heliangelus exortis TaxID=472823 RepID=UPI003A933F04
MPAGCSLPPSQHLLLLPVVRKGQDIFALPWGPSLSPADPVSENQAAGPRSGDISRMANFKGHALPGSFFLLFGLWWSVKYPLRYLSQRATKKSHRIYCFQRLDAIEGSIKIIFALIGFLFYYHILHRPMLDQHIHTLLLIAIFSGACSILLEVFLRDNIILEMFRAGITTVQGTWFWQIGIVLFQPWGGRTWDEDHSNIMFLTMCFFWHWAAAVAILAINYTLAYCCIQQCQRRSGEPYIGLGVRRQEGDPSSQTAFLNGSDEE